MLMSQQYFEHCAVLGHLLPSSPKQYNRVGKISKRDDRNDQKSRIALYGGHLNRVGLFSLGNS